MEVLSSLTACPECNNVFRYYDYLSHIEICHHTIGNNNNNETNENNDYDGDSMDTEIDEDDTSSIINSNYNYNGINNYANYMGYINTNTTNTTTSINNLSTYLSSININAGLDQGQLNNNSQQIECNTRTDCPVCLCSFPEKTLFYRLNCSHLFCIECCETWFKKHTNCPLCRNNYK